MSKKSPLEWKKLLEELFLPKPVNKFREYCKLNPWVPEAKIFDV